MRVEIPAPASYVKAIYLAGLQDYPNEQCRPKINQEQDLYVFDLSLKDVFECGVTRMLNQLTVSSTTLYTYRMLTLGFFRGSGFTIIA